MPHLIAPSLLSANFLNLASDIEMVNNSFADWFHVDVMDGHFVPNISFGFSIISQIKSIARKPLDVHLMIANPDNYVDAFKKAGADNLTVHYETCTHLHRTVQSIKEAGMKAGVVINPHNPVELLTDIVADVDLVLIMSVNPGFGGQKFIQSSLNRISRLKDLLIQKNSKALIEIDGGVDTTNAKTLVEAGVDVLVAGSAVFGAQNPTATIRKLKELSN
ncbi:MAG: ribulose-phosphate 3-epimerase [Bacteroidetes bacterium]|nr:MAG: ribulose-phosphate 3-epimerase [Bacteroidota bacterium]